MRVTFLLLTFFGVLKAHFQAVPQLTCSSESVHEANSGHLLSLLKEIAESVFFRLVRVEVDGQCPIKSLTDKSASADSSSTCSGSQNSSPFLGFGESPTDHGPSACEVQAEFSPQEIANTVDTRISPEEEGSYAQSEFPGDSECAAFDGSFRIRPDYWLDICSEHGSLSASEYVNLLLNPERNTGYNGSLVWTEMHGSVETLSEWKEGRILGKIISGYHASVTTQIMANYFPPGGKRNASTTAWLPNLKRFAESIDQTKIREMEFALVALSRALFKIKDYLYNFSFSTGNPDADANTSSLMRRFLDSSLHSLCGAVVVRGFDESDMFNRLDDSTLTAAKLFKRTVRKLLRMPSCVSCHRCRLHATVALRGIAVGLKILLTDPELVVQSISRDDVVSLVNIVHKLSESLDRAQQMMNESRERAEDSSAALLSRALRDVASLRSSLVKDEEDALNLAINSGNKQLLHLAQSFTGSSFVRLSLMALGFDSPDAVVVGGGLAGLVTAISLSERGASVVILEKQAALGGNSAKASSGINSAGDVKDHDQFLADTLKSQGVHGDRLLARTLVANANASVSWLQDVTGVALDSVGQLGGHSSARTWKPAKGVVGAELMSALIGAVKKRNKGPHPILVLHNVKATGLVYDDEGVRGVEYQCVGQEHLGAFKLRARAVVLASGGFGFDSRGLLQTYRPDLVSFPTTLGSHTTGDGIRLAAQLGADLVDMEFVQLHPTGFVDRADPSHPVKALAAEVLRGAGAILVDPQTQRRFVNELGTRKHVTDVMLSLMRRRSGADGEVFWLILSDKAASAVGRLAEVYLNRKLLLRIDHREELSREVGAAILDTLRSYSNTSIADQFGRVDKEGLPFDTSSFWLVGQVTPVVHYTMGGVRIDSFGRVLDKSGQPIPGFFAVGEVSGGVHGENRLGGNSLLECTVYGRIIGGSSIAVQPLEDDHISHRLHAAAVASSDGVEERQEEVQPISAAMIRLHATVEDCWTKIDGKVYNLSAYADQHPGGEESIRLSCGKDSTKRYMMAHSLRLLDDFGFKPIGIALD